MSVKNGVKNSLEKEQEETQLFGAEMVVCCEIHCLFTLVNDIQGRQAEEAVKRAQKSDPLKNGGGNEGKI